MRQEVVSDKEAHEDPVVNDPLKVVGEREVRHLQVTTEHRIPVILSVIFQNVLGESESVVWIRIRYRNIFFVLFHTLGLLSVL